MPLTYVMARTLAKVSANANSLCSPRSDKRNLSEIGTLRKFDRSEPQPQALILAGLTSRSLLELTIGITRRFTRRSLKANG